jgi:peptidyl-prolyl cis-trans isomerase C
MAGIARPLGALSLLAIVLALASCQQPTTQDDCLGPPADVVFGDGTQSNSPVICEVGDLKITQRDLDLRKEELTDAEKRSLGEEDSDRLLLRYMVNEALLVKAAYEERLYEHPDARRTLIANRRATMVSAMRNLRLLKDREPTQEEIRQYYLANRDRYLLAGKMHARHIETDTEAQARAVYDELAAVPAKSLTHAFIRAVAEYSTNRETKGRGGDLGWFNKGGFVKDVAHPREFSTAVWGSKVGLNEPIFVKDKWHVLQVLAIDPPRPMTFEQAYDRVKAEMLPQWQGEIVKDFLDQKKSETEIVYYGDYRPGMGKSADELFERALLVTDTAQKQVLFELILDDYPDSQYIDDTLFLLANLVLDTQNNQLEARRYLQRLIDWHPDSEYVDDARYILENMGKPGFTKPRSIEDLRR